MFNSFGLGEIIVIFFMVIILCIPILLVWLLFKTLRKISSHSEDIEHEMKTMREEIQAIRNNMPGSSPK
jgi:uncharacterized protein YoxC